MRRSASVPGVLAMGALLASSILASGVPGAAAEPDASSRPLGPACEEMEAVVEASPVEAGPIDWPAVPSDREPANGNLVSMAFGADERTNLMVIPLDGAPLDRITTWPTTSLPLLRIGVRGDGAALALPFYFGNGCADVLVLTADGQAARRPFRERVPEAVMSPSWSPDGTLLAVVGQFGVDAGGRLLSVPGSVWTWEPATDTIRRLGRPCEGCWLTGIMEWSPDGSRLAVAFTGGRCPRFFHTPDDPRDEEPEPSMVPPCWSPGIALVDRDGAWRTVEAEPDITEAGYTNPAGWLDDHTLLLEDGAEAGVRLDVDTGAWEPIRSPVGGVMLSPDRRRAVMVDADDSDWWLTVVDLTTGETTRIDVPYPDPRVTWSPDSTTLALLLVDEDGNDRGIHLVPADGSAPATLLRRGSFGVPVWLPR